MFHRPYERVRVSSPPKNNFLSPHSAYNTGMGARNHSHLSRVGSLLVVLCLLTAPLCASRCTLSSCVMPDSQEKPTSGCHHQSKHSDGPSVLVGAIAPTCPPPDSLLTTLPAQQFRFLSADLDHVTPFLSMAQDSSSLSGNLGLTSLHAPNRNSPPGTFALPFSNSPLRL
jgi:hypothetical protein